MTGSRLIVEGQPMLSAKVFEVGFLGKKGSLPDEHREPPTTTTTTTILPTPTPEPTSSPTPSITQTPTITPTMTPSSGLRPTSNLTYKIIPNNDLRSDVIPDLTPTPTPTPTPTRTLPPVGGLLFDIIPNNDLSSDVTPDLTPTPTPTPTSPPVVGFSYKITPNNDLDYEVTPDPSPTPSNTPTNTVTPTITSTPPISGGVTSTPTPTLTNTPTPTITETPTNTPTPTLTETPTNTPTPTSTPIPVTGYPFNLVILPYNYPTSGNTIMVDQVVPGSGTTNPNLFTTNGNGIYFDGIDSNGVDRTSYFKSFTGQSVTITLSQTGSTTIYSGDTNAFQSWTGNTSEGPATGFTFGTGIAQPGFSAGTAVLIQSATTNFTVGLPVNISVEYNNPPVTPTPTATSVTPTPTPTSGLLGDGWLFYTPEGPVQGPPITNGNILFISSGNSTFNPNIVQNMFLNTGTTSGTSYYTQFQTLNTDGGTLQLSQGSNTIIYSGDSSHYNIGPGYLNFVINNPSQIIQSASSPFVSGSTINITVN